MSDAPAGVDINTHDWNRHVPPGRKRAPFYRYIRINLPRLTKAVILAVMALLAFCAGVVALGDHLPFVGGDIALWLVVTLAGIFLVAGLVTRARIWDFGMVPALGALIAYLGGLFGTAPYVWNGASVHLAAAWNTMMLCGLAYLIIRWALAYGILVAYPDDQGFVD